MSCNDGFAKVSRDRAIFAASFPVEDFTTRGKSLRLPSGHLMSGRVRRVRGGIWTPTGKSCQVLAARSRCREQVRRFFLCDVSVVAQWPRGAGQLAGGNGPGSHSGVQLLEFDQAGEIVWTWSKADLISSLQGVLCWMGWIRRFCMMRGRE